MGSDFSVKYIPESWEFTTLGELLDKENGSVQTGPFGSQLHAADYVAEGIPSVMPKNITIEGINEEDIARITPQDANRLKKYLLLEGDIIYSRRGDVEKCALVKIHESGWLCGTGCLRIRLGSDSRISSEYLHAYLSTPAIREWISRNAIGATMPNLNTGILKNVPLVVPTKESVNFIADLWLDLNSKIILNLQTNQTLEKMAQTLFKSWFVDFDPVFDNLLAKADFKLENLTSDFPEALRHKAQLRLTALQGQASAKNCELVELFSESENNTHSHFPSEFEFNEQLGLIPKGWVENTIDDLCKINPQSWTKKNAPKTVKYVDLANAKNGSIGEVANYSFEDAPSRARRILQPHDTIIGVVRPANRSFAYVNEEGLTGSTGFAVVRVNQDNYRAFVYLSLTNEDCIKEFTRIADGAAYPAIKPEDVAKAECIYSSESILNEFENLVSSMMNKIATNNKQNIELTKLRDTLLPKLISGELQIPDVDISE